MIEDSFSDEYAKGNQEYFNKRNALRIRAASAGNALDFYRLGQELGISPESPFLELDEEGAALAEQEANEFYTFSEGIKAMKRKEEFPLKDNSRLISIVKEAMRFNDGKISGKLSCTKGKFVLGLGKGFERDYFFGYPINGGYSETSIDDNGDNEVSEIKIMADNLECWFSDKYVNFNDPNGGFTISEKEE